MRAAIKDWHNGLCGCCLDIGECNNLFGFILGDSIIDIIGK